MRVNISDINELKHIENEYEMGSIKILSDYFLLLKNYKKILKEEVNSNCSKEKKKNKFTDTKFNFNVKKDYYFKQYQLPFSTFFVGNSL